MNSAGSCRKQNIVGDTICVSGFIAALLKQAEADMQHPFCTRVQWLHKFTGPVKGKAAIISAS